ncbi:hypothetical protein SARC_12431 [Sphaeroforma arctica JP610]|uniref:Cytosine-specific methyltransferase n=1 Tax=Sphaeroforma arctica JP610 TaxID=667725 RepID=A0A0L0FEZ6_9EUKA|nr:hypothetical protein SARC_12431 [Sphaeroforma arctica JP610]KNC75036.1 hypothetical protein SARC_12431 [Sphaeroforma arctica JP610]|eukprot:XP_014148938.1 hypothetical protein SARC_12431 [Sphaeroforma arctica JP610]
MREKSPSDTPSAMNQIDLEPVLAVPPALTTRAFNLLREAGCVAMRWHSGGRYGSRTHTIDDDPTHTEALSIHHPSSEAECTRHSNGNEPSSKHLRPSVVTGTSSAKRMGLPLTLTGGAHVSSIMHTLKESRTAQYVSQTAEHISGDAIQPGDSAQTDMPRSAAAQALVDLLQLPGVELQHKPITLHTNIPKDESIDAEHIRTVEVARSRLREFSNVQIPGSGMKREEQRLEPPAFTFVELFAGIGGFGVGLEALGGKCVFASELLPSCIATYETNLCTDYITGGHVAGDIYEVPDEFIPTHDILVGGFPCQTFSGLGEQNGISDASGRGMLYTQIVRVLKAKQPQAFLLENVPGLLKCDDGEALDTIIGELINAGYDVSHEVVNAKCLTAQSRKRLYIVGLRKGLQSVYEPFTFPCIPDLGLRAIDILQSDSEIHEATPVPIENSIRGANLHADNTAHRDHAMPGCESSTKPGRSDLESLYRLSDAQLNQLTNARKWKPSKLAWPDKPLNTLNSHYGVSVGKGESQLVPSPAPHNPRRLTPRECARVMGFPDSYTLLNRDPSSRQGREAYLKEQYRMLGNAVCPPVITALAGSVLARCTGTLGHRNRDDWASTGVEVAVALSLGAVSPNRLESLLQRLQDTHVVHIVE